MDPSVLSAIFCRVPVGRLCEYEIILWCAIPQNAHFVLYLSTKPDLFL
jgi:hypothetical protein